MDSNLLGLEIGAFLGLLLTGFIFGYIPLLFQQYMRNTSMKERLLSLGNAFTGGLFLAGGFVHLLKEGQELFAKRMANGWEDIPMTYILCPAGFFLPFLVEKVIFLTTTKPASSLEVLGMARETTLDPDYDEPPMTYPPYIPEQYNEDHGEREYRILNPPRINLILPYILVIVLSIHSLMAGIALGFQKDIDVALTIFLAMIGHKWVEAFALGLSLVKAKKRSWAFFGFIMMFAIVGPFGLLVGLGIQTGLNGSSSDITTAVMTTMASGTFIYVSIVDILIEEFQTPRDKYLKFFAAIIGFAAMTSLIFAFPHDHSDHNSDRDASLRSLVHPLVACVNY